VEKEERLRRLQMNDLAQNIDKLHTTRMGAERIKRNLNLQTDDMVAWCKEAVDSKTPELAISILPVIKEL